MQISNTDIKSMHVHHYALWPSSHVICYAQGYDIQSSPQIHSKTPVAIDSTMVIGLCD